MDILSDKQAKSHTRKLGNGNLKKETKSLLIATQNNSVRTNYIKGKLDMTPQNANVGNVVLDTKQSITQ